MPSKHIRNAQSILGLSGELIKLIKEMKKANIDEIWEAFLKVNNSKDFPAYHSFDNFILSIDFLFMTNIIKFEGEVIKIETN